MTSPPLRSERREAWSPVAIKMGTPRPRGAGGLQRTVHYKYISAGSGGLEEAVKVTHPRFRSVSLGPSLWEA